MRTIVALPLLALGLAACEPYASQPGYPPPYPQGPQGYPQPGYPPESGYPAPPMPPGPLYPGPGQPVSQASYRAIGTEPFWDLEIGQNLTFTNRGNNVSVVQLTPQPIGGTAGQVYRTQRIEVNITHTRCSDGMSDRSYPDTVNVYVDGQHYRGCGAPIAFFSQVGETGQPNVPPPPGTYTGPQVPAPPGAYAGPPVPALSSSNWRVVAINGVRTPASGFYLNFMPDRIDAKFGCNSLGSGYTQSGNILTAGAVMATRMACPDMTFENQGTAVLMQPMTISGIGHQVTLSNRAGSIDLVRAN